LASSFLLTLFLKDSLSLIADDTVGIIRERIIAIFDVFHSDFPVDLQNEVSLTLDSTSWVAEGKGIQFSLTYCCNDNTSKSSVSNKLQPSAIFATADECFWKKVYCLISIKEASLVIYVISDGKCISFLCSSQFTVLFSTGKLSSHLAKAVETGGMAASVNGSSFVDSHWCKKCF